MNKIKGLLGNKILILDGAMGTMIQKYKLQEEDFRGEMFKNSKVLLKGNNDLLCLTQPQIIKQIHEEYLEAGADIIETNTFNAQSISMDDYDMKHMVREINIAAAQIAREAADKYTALIPDKPRFVAGAVGPTNRTASMSPKVEDPIYRAVTFDDLRAVYREQIEALVDGGVDLLLVETIFDTLNAKAALFAAEEVRKERGIELPIMISVTLTDRGGRTLSGQTIGGFLASISHINYLSVGVNCSFGAKDMKPFLKELGRIAPGYISCHPNAGLPNQFGEYDETPEKMASQIKEYIDEGLVNILGGCCGTSPAHIAAYMTLLTDAKPHILAPKPQYMWLSGLELLEATPNINFINVGERCNVAGSKRFLRLIKEDKYEEALSVAQKQVADGAQILDVNMDEGLLDGVKAMTTFLNMLASDPDVSRIPVMIDSSKWEVIEAGLKCTQGKSVVNSISLKEGEKEFLRQAALVQQYGAAVIVMAFDEKGQADTFDRRIDICGRAYKLLTENGFNPHDIIFDPNILAIATGIDEHRGYAVDFLKTIEWIKANLPHAKISGGVSNLSFSFRGNDYVREVMHSIFLYYAIQRGMDMGIVNAGQSVIYEDIPTDVRNLVEDVIFNRRAEATDELIEYAEKLKDEHSGESQQVLLEEWRTFSLEERLKHALVKGISDYMEEDLAEALTTYAKAVDIIDQPLMAGMNKVGDLFGAGKMFLPQVVKTARTMKRAVAILQPTLEREKSSSAGSNKAGKLLIATVKGDVHDIGKNIVAIILACNNYEVIDLGVMTPPEVIIAKIEEIKPDIVCLSGLITPSLEEMSVVANEMQKAGFSMPLMIGGATTSKLHTAIKIEPKYTSGSVVYVKDASQAPSAVSKLINPSTRLEYISDVKQEYSNLRDSMGDRKVELLPIAKAIEGRLTTDWSTYTPIKPNVLGKTILKDISIEEIRPFIDWKFFFHSWNLSARYATIHGIDGCPACRATWLNSFAEREREKAAEGAQLYYDAINLLDELEAKKVDYIRAMVGIYEAYSEDECIYINDIRFPMLRQQKVSEKGQYLSLCDYVAPKGTVKDYLAGFTVTAGAGSQVLMDECDKDGDEYKVLLLKSILDRLAEATTEWLHAKVRTEIWGFAPDENISVNDMFTLKYQGIRPAVGYPSIPDQSINFLLNGELLDSSDIGVELTENGVMMPNASVSGLIFNHPKSKYFNVLNISEDQVEKYIVSRGLDADITRKFLSANLL